MTNSDCEGPKALSSHPATRCVPDLHILLLSIYYGPGTKPDPGGSRSVPALTEGMDAQSDSRMGGSMGYVSSIWMSLCIWTGNTNRSVWLEYKVCEARGTMQSWEGSQAGVSQPWRGHEWSREVRGGGAVSETGLGQG